MIENVPFYVSAVFILTAPLAAGIFLDAAKCAAFSQATTKVLSFLIPFWLFFQAVLSITGFYEKFDSFPPRLPVFGALLCLATIVLLFVFARKTLVERLPLKTLTMIYVVRIPVEFVLLWLF